MTQEKELAPSSQDPFPAFHALQTGARFRREAAKPSVFPLLALGTARLYSLCGQITFLLFFYPNPDRTKIAHLRTERKRERSHPLENKISF